MCICRHVVRALQQSRVDVLGRQNLPKCCAALMQVNDHKTANISLMQILQLTSICYLHVLTLSWAFKKHPPVETSLSVFPMVSLAKVVPQV